jgi:hypothetical protein
VDLGAKGNWHWVEQCYIAEEVPIEEMELMLDASVNGMKSETYNWTYELKKGEHPDAVKFVLRRGKCVIGTRGVFVPRSGSLSRRNPLTGRGNF